MTCPDEIAEILLEILKHGILRIRTLADNPARCFIEAEHLHNLPYLVAHFSEDLLKFYWKVERLSFIEQSSLDNVGVFAPLRDRLATYLEPIMAR